MRKLHLKSTYITHNLYCVGKSNDNEIIICPKKFAVNKNLKILYEGTSGQCLHYKSKNKL